MNKRILTVIAIVAFFLNACNNENKNKKDSNMKDNPFLKKWSTPFQVPPFDKIKTEHFMPAYKEAMRQQKEEIEAIVNNDKKPSFENTILAYDQSGKLFKKVDNVFDNLRGANTNDELDTIAREVTPLISKHRDDIAMNKELFKKIKAVYDQRNDIGLDDQQKRVVEKYYQDFERRGANLNKEDQDKLRQINEELSMLRLKFGENLLAETNKNFKLVIEDEKDLAGLPQAVVENAASSAKEFGMEGKWVFTLQKPSMIPFLQYAENRDLREKLYRGYFMRGNNDNEFDNKEILAKMANLRVEKAKLLGFDSYADYVIDINMAKTPEKVDEFLMKIWKPALEVAKTEANDMQKRIDEEGGDFELAPWDWWYYAEKIRKQRYDLDANEVKPYFSLQNVRDGMFHVANQLYGITFEKREDLPLYHKDVETFEVKEEDGQHIGILYLDYHPRSSKGAGAWCTHFRSAGYDWEKQKPIDPVVSVVCNFTKPTSDAPALLTFDETETLFHEFGHALHGLFTEGKYRRTAGRVQRDYVELPSQIMENWAADPEVMKQYAKHYKTGEVIPDAIIKKLQKSSHFNQGFATVEYVAAALLDLTYHNLEQKMDFDVLDFEKQAMDIIGLIDEIIPRYRSTYFAHIFDGGYSAGYYVYIWAAVLDSDAFKAFKESGNIYNKELAASFRKHCLQECGQDEGMAQYVKFRGEEPSIDPLLEKRGLK